MHKHPKEFHLKAFAALDILSQRHMTNYLDQVASIHPGSNFIDNPHGKAVHLYHKAWNVVQASYHKK